MPLSEPQHYEERVFTAAVGAEIDGDKGCRDAARHVLDHDDPSALRWLKSRMNERLEIASSLTDRELKGTIEWYLRVGSSDDYSL